MIFLILAIISSSMVAIVMRLSSDKIQNNISMLAVNYVVCSFLAAAYCGFGQLFPSDPGLNRTLGMGVFNGFTYMLGFVLLQHNIRKNGVVLSNIFIRLGLLVPMVVSIVLFDERPVLNQIIGFLLAVTALVLINYEKNGNSSRFRIGLIILLLTGGTSDAMSKVFEEVGNAAFSAQFLFFTFDFALVFCIAFMLYRKEKLGRMELLYGVLVGIPNFFSARFLLKSLNSLPAVIAYPTYSVSGVLLVTLAGVICFREKLRKLQWIAVGIILIAVLLLNI